MQYTIFQRSFLCPGRDLNVASLLENPRFSILSSTGNFRFPTPSRNLLLHTESSHLLALLLAPFEFHSIPIDILKILGIKDINLLTNNPEKIKYVENSEINLNERIPLQIKANENSKEYLQTKKDYFGHLLEDDKNIKE